jgi:hypothetical protein
MDRDIKVINVTGNIRAHRFLQIPTLHVKNSGTNATGVFLIMIEVKLWCDPIYSIKKDKCAN